MVCEKEVVGDRVKWKAQRVDRCGSPWAEMVVVWTRVIGVEEVKSGKKTTYFKVELSEPSDAWSVRKKRSPAW